MDYRIEGKRYIDDETQAATEAGVLAGAQLLDEHMPGWHEKLEFEHFDIGSCTRCVIGQVFGNTSGRFAEFAEAVRSLGIQGGFEAWRAHGFYGDNCVLQPLWEAQVDERLNAVAA